RPKLTVTGEFTVCPSSGVTKYTAAPSGAGVAAWTPETSEAARTEERKKPCARLIMLMTHSLNRGNCFSMVGHISASCRISILPVESGQDLFPETLANASVGLRQAA